MKKGHFSRREFLQTSTGVAGGSLAASVIPLHQPLFAAERAAAPSDRVRFGIIGIGMEGTNLLSTAIDLPGVECVAACDLYDGRHELAREIVKKPIPTTRRYQELLDKKEIDAIVMAVPGIVLVPLPLKVRWPYDSAVTVCAVPLYSTVLVAPRLWIA